MFCIVEKAGAPAERVFWMQAEAVDTMTNKLDGTRGLVGKPMAGGKRV